MLMNKNEINKIQEKIIAVLKETGRLMSSTELEKALGLEWSQFHDPLGEMIQTVHNSGGRVLRSRDPKNPDQGDFYSLSS